MSVLRDKMQVLHLEEQGGIYVLIRITILCIRINTI